MLLKKMTTVVGGESTKVKRFAATPQQTKQKGFWASLTPAQKKMYYMRAGMVFVPTFGFGVWSRYRNKKAQEEMMAKNGQGQTEQTTPTEQTQTPQQTQAPAPQQTQAPVTHSQPKVAPTKTKTTSQNTDNQENQQTQHQQPTVAEQQNQNQNVEEEPQIARGNQGVQQIPTEESTIQAPVDNTDSVTDTITDDIVADSVFSKRSLDAITRFYTNNDSDYIYNYYKKHKYIDDEYTDPRYYKQEYGRPSYNTKEEAKKEFGDKLLGGAAIAAGLGVGAKYLFD